MTASGSRRAMLTPTKDSRMTRRTPARFPPPPFSLRLAAIICAGLGFYTFLATVPTAARLIELHRAPWLPLVGDPAGAVLIFLAGVLLWLRLRAGVFVLVAGGVLPPLMHRFWGGPIRPPNLLLLAVALLLAANLKRLR